MTAEAIRAAAANFRSAWRAFGRWLRAAKSRVRCSTRMSVALRPTCGSWTCSMPSPSSPSRSGTISTCWSATAHRERPRILAKHRADFDAVEKAYGVDRHVVAAIWGIESNYGTQIGDRSVVRSTATLACIGRRQDFFREEFLSALEILARGDVTAGASEGLVGGRFRPDAVHADLLQALRGRFRRRRPAQRVDSVPDLIASTANNLKKDGWVAGQTWGYEVVVPQGFNFLLADRSRMMTIREWESSGIRARRRQAFPRADDRRFLLVPAGAQGPGFLMLQNFRAIMKYNPAEAYALAIGHLADRLRGGGPFVQPWPRHERVLSRDRTL